MSIDSIDHPIRVTLDEAIRYLSSEARTADTKRAAQVALSEIERLKGELELSKAETIQASAWCVNTSFQLHRLRSAVDDLRRGSMPTPWKTHTERVLVFRAEWDHLLDEAAKPDPALPSLDSALALVRLKASTVNPVSLASQPAAKAAMPEIVQ